MSLAVSSSRLAEALARAGQHGMARRLEQAGVRGPFPPQTAFTVAVSRQVGALGTSVAHAVGRLLEWPVYDHELLERVAREMNVPSDRVASVDERPMSWLQECLGALSSAPSVTEDAYVHYLLETLFTLGAQGECVIVGRGAAQVLPAATTFRVRLVASLEDRIDVIRRQLGVLREHAARHIEETERERVRFIRDHFLKDAADPQNYDLVLNSSRYSVDECAGLIVQGLRRLQTRAAIS
jgi:cytidylate kinase